MNAARVVHGFDRSYDTPGLATEGASIHGQRTTNRTRHTGQKLRAAQALLHAEAREFGAGHAGLGAHRVFTAAFQSIQLATQHNHRAAHAAVTH